jgi:hypothetical protein
MLQYDPIPASYISRDPCCGVRVPRGSLLEVGSLVEQYWQVVSRAR